MKKAHFLLFSAALTALSVIYSCKSSSNSSFGEESSGEQQEVIYYNNPPAEGFDIEGSSTHAIVMADQVMHAMGGRQNWDATNVICWNFFGKRSLLWDKQNGKVRVDAPAKNWVVVLDLNEMTGKAWENGNPVVADSLAEYLQWAKDSWINDSYWLVMPFKLKDSGVTLIYDREDSTITGKRADVLKMTFKNVGNTPQNAYHIWVDYDTRLIEQWAYFKDAAQSEPSFVTPWTNYEKYGEILIASNRGDRDITDIRVLKEVPKGAFESPEPVIF